MQAPPAGLDALPPSLRLLADSGTERRYRKGTIFVREGEPGGLLYFVVEGRIRAYTARDDGQEYTFGSYGPGTMIGELSLDGGPRSASVAAETEVLCRIVTRQTLFDRLAHDQQLAVDLIHVLVRRARALSTRARQLALTPSRGRLIDVLLARSDEGPDGTRLVARMTQIEMAREIGCGRPLVTRLLGELERDGVIAERDRRWVILKLPASKA